MRISDWSSDVCSSDLFRRNQEQFKSAVEGAFANSPFAEITKRNIEMFEAATEAFKSGHPAPAAEASKDDEIAALKAEMARRSEERRVGKGCVRTCRSRGSPCH